MLRSVVVIFIVLVAFQTFSAFTAEDPYICPMECKKLEFDKPGTCPVCGMNLVKKAQFMKTDTRTTVAILLFDGVQIIDFTAPYEVFGQARFKVVTVAENKAPVTTSMNLTVTPDYDFSSVAAPDILVIPGGSIDSALNSAKTIQWIQNNSRSAQHVLSVCNGAFLLARSGLLDGLSATTFYRLIDNLQQQFPKTKVVSNQRFVDNGKIVTTAGLTSGMDGSLHVVSKILGKGEAQRIALHLEYQWKPDSKFARAALADMNLPNIDMPEGSRAKYLRTEGSTDHWELELLVTTELSRANFEEHIKTHLVSTSNWTEVQSGTDLQMQHWAFSDKEGNPWRATVRIAENSREKGYIVKVDLDRNRKQVKDAK